MAALAPTDEEFDSSQRNAHGACRTIQSGKVCSLIQPGEYQARAEKPENVSLVGPGTGVCEESALTKALAEKHKLPVQMRAVSRSTGTDTDSFAYANDGCPSVLISIPLRYMHTTVEMLHKRDIEQTILLMYETLLTLTPKTNLSYL